MQRIERAFRGGSRRALIPFLNAGDPDYSTSLELFRSVLRAGADMVEIGTPYSDPLADGPVIQSSAARSLRSGFQFPHAFQLSRTLRSETDKALVLFTYVNPLVQYTSERFFRDAHEAGIDGVIVPDLPFEESASIRRVADAYDVALIPLIAPTSGTDRVAAICKEARGFVYCVSSLGVTGERARMSNRLEDLVVAARSYTNVPIAVGFGVSTPEQAKQIAGFADGIIVGSAYIRRIEQCLSHSETTQSMSNLTNIVEQFTRSLRGAIDEDSM